MRSFAVLDASLDTIRAAPRDHGTIELIVMRPAIGERRLVEIAELDITRGLVGDSWHVRPSKHTPDGSPNLAQQLTLMSTRVLAAIAEPARWPLAGDQLLVDFDLSVANLPVGARLAIGDAVIEISAKPHTGCAKFTDRFGSDATAWFNTEVGRELRLRGVNATVIRGGSVRRGDPLRRG